MIAIWEWLKDKWPYNGILAVLVPAASLLAYFNAPRRQRAQQRHDNRVQIAEDAHKAMSTVGMNLANFALSPRGFRTTNRTRSWGSTLPRSGAPTASSWVYIGRSLTAHDRRSVKPLHRAREKPETPRGGCEVKQAGPGRLSRLLSPPRLLHLQTSRSRKATLRRLGETR